MVKYLQTRLNDLRDENLSLRERMKSQPSLGPHHHINQITASKTYSASELDYENFMNDELTGSRVCGLSSVVDGLNEEDLGGKLTSGSVITVRSDSSSDDENLKLYDEQLETKNELLQAKLEELQKLQMQLNTF